MTESEFVSVGNELRRNSRDRRILDFVDYANELMIAVKELGRPARSEVKGLKTADRNKYMREYMRDWRQGIRRQKEQKT
jgi:hypothetical protein